MWKDKIITGNSKSLYGCEYGKDYVCNWTWDVSGFRELLSDEKLYCVIQEAPMLYERATMVVIPKV